MTRPLADVIAELRALQKDATPGPWAYEYRQRRQGAEHVVKREPDEEWGPSNVCDTDLGDNDRIRAADAALIAATHNALDRLLAVAQAAETVASLPPVHHPACAIHRSLPHGRRGSDAGPCDCGINALRALRAAVRGP